MVIPLLVYCRLGMQCMRMNAIELRKCSSPSCSGKGLEKLAGSCPNMCCSDNELFSDMRLIRKHVCFSLYGLQMYM